MSGFNPALDPKAVLVRRWAIVNGVGGRRRWSPDDKARMVEETLAPGATLPEAARRHDIRPPMPSRKSTGRVATSKSPFGSWTV